MDITVQKTTTTILSDKSWIYGGLDGSLQNMLSETLDVTLFDADVDYPDGSIPSGRLLGRVGGPGGTGLLGPYDNTAEDGRETCVGALYEDEQIRTGQTRAAVAVFHDGVIVTANLPANSGLDAGARTDLKHITFRD